jgi:hypothetical protein
MGGIGGVGGDWQWQGKKSGNVKEREVAMTG